jgi:hypothetical protein
MRTDITGNEIAATMQRRGKHTVVQHSRFVVAICLAGSCFIASCGITEAADTRPILLENSSLRVTFDPTQGHLLSLVDRLLNHEFVRSGTDTPLWSLVLDNGRTVTPQQAGNLSLARSGTSAAIELHWTDFQEPAAPQLKVVATVSLEAQEPVVGWRIAVRETGPLKVRSMQYPCLPGIAPQDREVLAVPVWVGEKTDKPRQLLNGPSGGQRMEWSYPGILSLQCLAFYVPRGPGLMLSADDTTTARKHFTASGDGNGNVRLAVTHIPPETTDAAAFEPDYSVLVRLFRGDWFTAAEHYRDWANQQWWVKESRLRRGLVPEWVVDTGLWQWNRGASPGVLGTATALQTAAQVPVSVFWHWWHGCPYDAGFPEYLPPREGTEAFRQAVADAHQENLHCIVYMNQRLWGMTTASWQTEGAERFAVKNPDGSVTPEVYNTFMRVPCASMCMGTEFWRNKYAGLASAAVNDLGVDGIYMDQACSSLACYDATHGHPLGGGTWWMNGFQTLASDIRHRTASTKPVALAGEGCGEAWLPHLDMMLSLQVSMERYAAPRDWEPIPFFQAVYHDCAVQFGNYSSLTRPPYDELWPAETAPPDRLQLLDRKFAQQFRLEQARAFVWGQQPSLANFLPEHLATRSEEMDYVIRLARLRRAARKYLQGGVFLRPPETDTGDQSIPISRLSIYAGQQEAVQEYEKPTPQVLSSAWRAADGSIAVVIANLSDQVASLHLALNSTEYPLPTQGVVRRIEDDRTSNVARFGDGRAAWDVTLDPLDVGIYECISD